MKNAISIVRDPLARSLTDRQRTTTIKRSNSDLIVITFALSIVPRSFVQAMIRSQVWIASTFGHFIVDVKFRSPSPTFIFLLHQNQAGSTAQFSCLNIKK